jgi:hypothetical protein
MFSTKKCWLEQTSGCCEDSAGLVKMSGVKAASESSAGVYKKLSQ